MTRLVIAVEPGVQSSLAREFERNGREIFARCASSNELVELIRSGSADATTVVISAAPQFLSAAVVEESDRHGVRLVALVVGNADRRFASTVGILDTVVVGAPWEVLEAALDGPAAPVEQQRSRGTVIAVWGPVGAPGRSSVATGLAAELAAAGLTVALVDADPWGASIAPSLGLLDEAPGFAAACRLAGAGSLARGDLERLGQRYLSGHGSFWVLTGISNANRWTELTTDRVAATMAACREWVDVTVVDTGFCLENDEELSSDLGGPRRNASTIAALHAADAVFAVGLADTVGLPRLLRGHAELCGIVDPERVRIVVNRVRAATTGMRPVSQIAEVLARFAGISQFVSIPDDRAAHDLAQSAGRTLRDTAVRSPARVALGRLAEPFVPTGLVAEPTRRSLRRPRGALTPALRLR